MLRALATVPVIAFLLGCSASPQRVADRPISPPEFRAEASIIAGHKPAHDVIPPSNARIQLAPSPGRRPPVGNKPIETLESNPDSGAYITTIGRTPITQYFEILRPADCDDWINIRMRTPKDYRNLPAYYFDPDYPEDKPAYLCAEIFHRHFARHDDERLEGADGVLFDPSTGHFTQVDGFLVTQKKFFMRGWAIRFVAPTEEMIEQRLRSAAILPVERLQMRSAIYWIVANKKVDRFAALLQQQLPLQDEQMRRAGWNEEAMAALNALAMHEALDGTLLETNRKVLRVGLEGGLRAKPGQPRVVVPLRGLANAPEVAAKTIACKGSDSDLALLEELVLQTNSRQHAEAAARGLMVAGKGDLLKKHVQFNYRQLGSAYDAVKEIAYQRDPLAFKCS